MSIQVTMESLIRTVFWYCAYLVEYCSVLPIWSRYDPPGSRRPIRRISPVKGAFQDSSSNIKRSLTESWFGGVGQDVVTKGKPLLDSPKKNAVPEFSRAAPKSPSKKVGHPTHKAEEQARRQKYATDLFAKLNKDVFGDRLPKNTTLEWSKRLLTTAGRARWHR